MTRRLFDEDSYIKTFTARVLSCIPCGDKAGTFAVVLDATAFYPEGGGQAGDTGFLTIAGEGIGPEEDGIVTAAGEGAGPEEDGIVTAAGEEAGQAEGGMVTGGREKAGPVRVLDTQEKGEEIRHLTDRPLEPGTVVTGEICWEERFDRMQNHSGEHIVSGLIHEKYGYNNVGFHMGSDFITIDLDGELTMEELREIELKANTYVWTNAPVITEVCTGEEAKTRTYRSKKELTGLVRLVTFPGADVCACCGTHVRSTGEIGLIRIISSVKFRGGSRIEMLCGKRAFLYDTAVTDQNHAVSVLLSAKVMETAAAVSRVKDSEADARYRVMELEQKLFAMTADREKGAGNVALICGPMAPDSVRRLAVAVMETCGGTALACAGSDEDGYKYALGQENGDLRSFVKEMNGALQGRGGGKPFFAQGSMSAPLEEIERFLDGRSETWKVVRLQAEKE